MFLTFVIFKLIIFYFSFSSLSLSLSPQHEVERRNLEAEIRALKRVVADLDSALSEATETNAISSRELDSVKSKLTRLVSLFNFFCQ